MGFEPMIAAKIAFIFTSLTSVQIYDFHILTTNKGIVRNNERCVSIVGFMVA